MSADEKLPPQPWMQAPETRAVIAALGAEGREVRFVGGCVRDALVGRPVRDVDIATPDRPEVVSALLERAAIKVIPTGLDHGTVTAVVAHRPFEITTLRRDLETDGRRARVAFTDDWQADAARRDLTMNALSCTPDGTLHDYFGGVADLRAGRVRFVGDPRQRIREDYLRLLRFFRFQAHYGRGAPDAAALQAASEAAPQLASLSGERIREELLRLLAAADPLPVLATMRERRILVAVLPEVEEPEVLARLLPLEGEAADPLLRLAALIACRPGGVEAPAGRLRLSNRERLRLVRLTDSDSRLRADLTPHELRVACHRDGAPLVADLLRLTAARAGRADGLEGALAEVARWTPKTLPIRGGDLIRLGLPPGPAVSRLLAEIKAWWVERDFTPDRTACLAEAHRRLRQG